MIRIHRPYSIGLVVQRLVTVHGSGNADVLSPSFCCCGLRHAGGMVNSRGYCTGRCVCCLPLPFYVMSVESFDILVAIRSCWWAIAINDKDFPLSTTDHLTNAGMRSRGMQRQMLWVMVVVIERGVDAHHDGRAIGWGHHRHCRMCGRTGWTDRSVISHSRGQTTIAMVNVSVVHRSIATSGSLRARQGSHRSSRSGRV